jgi:hypothetical protein
MSEFFTKCTCAVCVGLVSVSLVGHAEDCPRQALCGALPPDQVHGHEDQRPTINWIKGIKVAAAESSTSSASMPWNLPDLRITLP